MARTPAPPPSGGKDPVHNRDLAPRSDPQAPDIAALLDNEIVWNAFEAHEEAAKRLKGRYELLGRISVLCIGASAICAAFNIVWGSENWFRFLNAATALLGAIGIVLDLYIRGSGLKLRWLIHRFGAERLRSVKFQLYALAVDAGDRDALRVSVQEKAEAAVAQIRQDLLMPVGTLNAFHPSSSLDLPARAAPADPPAGAGAKNSLLAQAIRDYREWRVKYQHLFAEQMSRDIASRQRGYDSLSDGLFVLGAAVLVLGVMVRMIELKPSELPQLLEAIGLAMFVGTAMGNVLSTGASHLTNNSRYQQYARDVSRLLDRQPTSPTEFVELVGEMELLALRELDNFWRDAWISSYRS